MSKVIIVCGLCAAGKTTLAKKISSQINTVLLSRDNIQEALFDSFEDKSIEGARKAGKRSMDLIFEIGEYQIKNKVDVILEAPFAYETDYEVFRRWIADYGIELVCIYCYVDSQTRKVRFEKRMENRHLCHKELDKDRAQNVSFENEIINLDLMPGKIIKVDTNEDLEKIMKIIINQL